MPSIAFWMPDTFIWGDLTTTPHIGGREWNVVRVAEELARLGWEAAIYCPTPGLKVKNGVRYLAPDYLPTSDVVVVLNDYDVLRKLRGPQRLVWLCTGLPDLAAWRPFIDGVVVSSPAKERVICEVNPWLDPAKVSAIYSGTDPQDYQVPASRRSNRLLWCSNRERGLHHLLRWWPRLRRSHPDLELHVTYDPRSIEGWRWQQEMRAEVVRLVQEGVKQPGVVDLGAVTREQLVREQKETTLWACPVEFYGGFETGSFTVVEMCAARTPMLLSEDPSFTELGRGVAHFLPYPIDDEQWIGTILELLRDPLKRRIYETRQRQIAHQYTWRASAQHWDRLYGPRVVAA